MSNPLTVSGLGLTSGSLVIGGNSLTINGAVTSSAGNINSSTGSSLTIAGSGTLATIPFASGSQISTLTMNRAVTLNTSGGVSMANNGLITLTQGTIGTAFGAAGVYDVTYNRATSANSGEELPNSSTALRHVVNQAAGTITLTKALQATGNLTLNAGSGGINPATFNVSVGGNFTQNSSTAFNQTGGTFSFTGTGAHAFSGTGSTTFNALSVAGALTASSSATITGDLSVASSSSIDVTSGIWTFVNSTISNSGTIEFDNIDVTTSLTAPLNGALTISGNMTGNGTFNANGSTITFNGSSQILGASKTFFNVVVSGASTLGGAILWQIDGALINDGTIDWTSSTLTWNSTSTLSGAGTTNLSSLTVANGATLNYNSTGDMSLLNNLTLNGDFNQSGAAQIMVEGNATGAGDLTITGTLSLNPPTASNFFVLGDISIDHLVVGSNGGTVTVGQNTSYTITNLLEVQGGLTTNSGGSSTTTFSATSSIADTGVDITLGNMVIATGANFTAPSSTVFLNGDFTDNAAFLHGNGTIAFNSTGSATKFISGSTATTFYNLAIEDNAHATDVANNSSVSIIGVLSLSSGAVFDADGTSGSFTLLSTADAPADDASVGALLGGARVDGNITVQRWVSKEGVQRLWRYISPPVEGATVADWMDDFWVTGSFAGAHNGSTPGCTGCLTNPSSYYYNEATQAYVAYPTPTTGSSANPLTNGRGYSVFMRQNIVNQSEPAPDGTGEIRIDYTGTHPNPVDGSVDLPIAPNVNGYSLVGNPYPSPIIWGGAGVTTNGVGTTVWITDNVGGAFVPVPPGGVIATGQAFWVQTTGASPSVSISETAKTSTTDSPTEFYRAATVASDEVVLKLTKKTNNLTNGLFDKARLVLKDGASLSSDSYDAVRIFDNSIQSGSTVQMQDLSIMSADSKKLAISAIPSLNCSQEFILNIDNYTNPAYASMGITAESTVEYDLEINASGALAGMTWKLVDNFPWTSQNGSPTPVEIDLSTNTTYHFYVSSGVAASRAANRFKLVALNTAVNTAVTVAADAKICGTSDAWVKIAGSQKGMLYGAEVNGVKYPALAQGNGGDLSVQLDAEWLTSVNNSVKLFVNSGCETADLASALSIERVAIPVAQASSMSSCTPGSVKLTAAGAPANGKYRWYASPSSTNALSEGAEFMTPYLAATTDYYVAAVNELGCEGARQKVTASIGTLGASLAVSQQTPQVCLGSATTLIASGAPADGTYRWYKNLTDTNPVASASEMQIASVESGLTYYVTAVDASGCESEKMQYTVTSASFDPILSGQQLTAICSAGSTTLQATGPEGVSYKWFTTETASEPIADGDRATTPTLSANATWYVQAFNSNGCASRRFPVQVSVSSADPSLSISTESLSICKDSEGFISITSIGANFKWYASATSPEIIAEGSTFRSPVINQTTDFFVAAVNEFGCEGSRKRVTLPVQSYDEAAIEVSGAQLLSNYPSGNSWYLDGELISSESAVTVARGGYYVLNVAVKGCETSAAREMQVTDIEGTINTMIDVYPIPAREKVTIKNNMQAPSQFTMVDSRGAEIVVFSLGPAERKEIETAGLSSGMYVLKIRNGSQIAFKKLIIK